MFHFLAHKVSLQYTSRAGVRPSVCSSVCVLTIFKHEYLHNQWADNNQILIEASLGWGKSFIKLWARSDQNSGFHGNRSFLIGSSLFLQVGHP